MEFYQKARDLSRLNGHDLSMMRIEEAISACVSGSKGIGMKQIGQSPRCVLSGCLSKSSTRNSAALFCRDLCSF